MYKIEVVTPPAEEPVTISELKGYLRWDDSSEDEDLAQFITLARTLFETDTLRTVISTVYKQHFYSLGKITLMRNEVTSIQEIKYYDTNNSLTAWTDYDYETGIPFTIWGNNNVYPSTSQTKKPVGYVKFTAGWADRTEVPADIKVGIKLLAAYFFSVRENYSTDSLKEIPDGFSRIANKYRSGITGLLGNI